MPPVIAAVGAALTTAAAATSAASVFTAVASYTLKAALMAGVSRLATELVGPKQKQAARQASVTTLSLGEQPREAIFGRAQTGGTLDWAWNYGGKHDTDREVVVIIVADHLCDALEGFWVDDQYYAFTADGPHADFYLNGKAQLDVYWRAGTSTQTFPASLQAGGGFTNDDLKGVAYVVFDYKYNANGKVFSAGRPAFKMLVRGKKLYDPRKDSTVGGSGSHRWATPSTWEWSENAYLCRYNWARGIYALDQVGSPQHLLIGRGLSDVEAPPANAFAPANLCDEDVALKAGGTEKRYRVGGVIRADQEFIEVEEMFAAAMAGEIIQPEGTIDIAPGVAKASVVTITDADLVIGEPVLWSEFLEGPERVNSVIPSYVEPAQNWQTHAAPVRRSLTDIATDGGPFEETLDLALVTSGTQAQRCGEIRRRRVRHERSRTITLGPRFSRLQEGDWITWTSSRFDGGASRVWQIKKHVLAASRRITLSLVEIAASDYAWTAASDETTPGTAPSAASTAPTALELDDVSAASVDVAGVPGVRVYWDTPVDEGVWSILAEVRLDGTTETTPTNIHDVQAGVADITAGVGSNADVEVRLTPLGDVERDRVASAWKAVASSPMVAEEIVGQGNLATLDQVNTAQIVDNAVTDQVVQLRPTGFGGAGQITVPYSVTFGASAYTKVDEFVFTYDGSGDVGIVWIGLLQWQANAGRETAMLLCLDQTPFYNGQDNGYDVLQRYYGNANNSTATVVLGINGTGLTVGSHTVSIYGRGKVNASNQPYIDVNAITMQTRGKK